MAQQRGTQNAADAAALAGATVIAEKIGGDSRTDSDVATAVDDAFISNDSEPGTSYYVDYDERHRRHRRPRRLDPQRCCRHPASGTGTSTRSSPASWAWTRSRQERAQRPGRRSAQSAARPPTAAGHAGDLLDSDHLVRRHQQAVAHRCRLAARRPRHRQGRHIGPLRVDRSAVQERPGRRWLAATWAAAATSRIRSTTRATALSRFRLWLQTRTGNANKVESNVRQLHRSGDPDPDVRLDLSRHSLDRFARRLHRPGQRQQPLLPHTAVRQVPAR